jgi:hypothetical protein
MKCERCGREGLDIEGEVTLCRECLVLIVREWKIHHEEDGELAGEKNQPHSSAGEML